MMNRKILLIVMLVLLALIPANIFADNTIPEDNTDKLLFETNTSEISVIELLKFYQEHYDGKKNPIITNEDIAEYESALEMFSIISESIPTRTAVSTSNPFNFPGYYSYYYKNQTAWITRDGKISLSVHYKPDEMFPSLPNGNVTLAYAANAFNVLKYKHIGNTPWNNTASMEAQFHCHYTTIGKLKNPWNLEPWRTQTNLALTIAAGCNP